MAIYYELDHSCPELPVDLELATKGMDVSADLVLRYCAGPHVAHTALADSRPRQTPSETPKRAAVAVLELEAMWNA